MEQSDSNLEFIRHCNVIQAQKVSIEVLPTNKRWYQTYKYYTTIMQFLLGWRITANLVTK
jgi:hypothetical protein